MTTEERANKILDYCNLHGWEVIIGIEPDEREDISDIQKLLGEEVENTKTIINEVQVGRNDPCICGSSKKYKKCCGK